MTRWHRDNSKANFTGVICQIFSLLHQDQSLAELSSRPNELVIALSTSETTALHLRLHRVYFVIVSNLYYILILRVIMLRNVLPLTSGRVYDFKKNTESITNVCCIRTVTVVGSIWKPYSCNYYSAKHQIPLSFMCGRITQDALTTTHITVKDVGVNPRLASLAFLSSSVMTRSIQ